MWYSDYHVWILPIHERVVRLGLTEKMRNNLGTIVHVDLPSIGNACKEGEVLVVLESSKSAIEVLSPVTGEVIDVNLELLDNSQKINDAPEGEGWLVIVRLEQDWSLLKLSLMEQK
ncbi:Glycine cleavage system H protein,glycine cleavage system protein H,Glycine cleavage system H protein (lipoate-binding),glycine cleavage protein H-like protein,Glycine cleavage H-protein [Chlamydia serpentis]|uniref:Glycine cleavage system H-like protein n=1 Tax=Chlamydia serpentis TaxID=1967782 RepID=A0A2R8FAW1_9CHLA|nr:glycine cleavage protein H-like protein [Chlamydia serpentis]SPN73568.1 Glycine cleavage system H protein,glycine cleavage system protein H,Glycine cleavage system H protein (lipoate-binding),glycine cleavage protein H-like protein,Glycine cleavage H-protein [Chlamydia serpentis]